MTHNVDIGLLVSTHGTYKDMGRSTRAGLCNAIDEINGNPDFDFTLRPQSYDPCGELQHYVTGVNRLIAGGAKHVFGTTTSASRKEIIPDLERARRLLWYPCPYEGYECSENVVYLGGCPNQNLLPLIRFALSSFGGRAALIGSNYVWGWESNRIARELIEIADGKVLSEKYYRFGDTGFEALIDSILDQRPDFVLNNLVGESSYHFLRQLSDACAIQGIRIPVLSCNFTESELPRIQGAESVRLLSCGAFFENVDPEFVTSQRNLHGDQPFSHYYTCAYLSMYLFAAALLKAGNDDPGAIANALYHLDTPTVLGDLTVAEHNNHLTLPSYIAEANRGRFEVIHTEGRAVAADPYLVQTDLDVFRALGARTTNRSFLRVVK